MAIRGCESKKSQANSWKFDQDTGIFHYKGKCLTRGSQTETGDLLVEGIFQALKMRISSLRTKKHKKYHLRLYSWGNQAAMGSQ